MSFRTEKGSKRTVNRSSKDSIAVAFGMIQEIKMNEIDLMRRGAPVIVCVLCEFFNHLPRPDPWSPCLRDGQVYA
ncbi:MAG: hypothetical protein ABSG44_09210 [Thermodesulfobacteriota bacterium]